jgi:energy-coupling factor transporter ATP-binding protein EcfA2
MGTPQFSLQQNAEGEDRITYFGVTDTRGKHVPFGIKQEDRSRHTYVIGKTGMGKSTLLENMAVQDIQSGEGLCFIDPHGGTAEKLMEYIPEDRVKDVLYFAPFDLEYPISFNVLENVDADKRHLVVAGLMSAFEKIWVDAWSARMAYILQNTIGALLEFPGATLLAVNRMYIDKEYRKNVVAKVTDPSVRSFWVDEFTKYTDRYAQEATPAIQNKIGQFASNALVRNVIGQETSSFDIRELMDDKKIFIVNLSKGRVGEGNANLLGSMLITKIYLAAMSRADVAPGKQKALPPFYLFVDEFQNFANKSFAEILSEARKYKLALTIAHQYIEQMEDEVRAAVFGNVGSMLTFRVGAYDADVLEKEFAPTFEVDDLVNLGARQIYLKLMIDGVSSQPFSATTMPPIPEPEVNQTDTAIAYSRATYARPRAEVEKAIEDWSNKKYEDPEAEEKERARQERRAARDAAEQRPPRAHMQSVARKPLPTQPRAPRSADQPKHTERPTTPRARVSTVVSKTATTPRTPQPVRKEQRTEDLRSVLATVAKKEDGKEALKKAPTPARDDGKGVTDEGKAELRNLLAGLTKGQASASAVSTPAAKTPPQPSVGAPGGISEPTPTPEGVKEAMEKQEKAATHTPTLAPTPAKEQKVKKGKDGDPLDMWDDGTEDVDNSPPPASKPDTEIPTPAPTSNKGTGFGALTRRPVVPASAGPQSLPQATAPTDAKPKPVSAPVAQKPDATLAPKKTPPAKTESGESITAPHAKTPVPSAPALPRVPKVQPAVSATKQDDVDPLDMWATSEGSESTATQKEATDQKKESSTGPKVPVAKAPQKKSPPATTHVPVTPVKAEQVQPDASAQKKVVSPTPTPPMPPRVPTAPAATTPPTPPATSVPPKQEEASADIWDTVDTQPAAQKKDTPDVSGTPEKSIPNKKDTAAPDIWDTLDENSGATPEASPKPVKEMPSDEMKQMLHVDKPKM